MLYHNALFQNLEIMGSHKMATKKILILGGGYGGVWAGKILEKHFRKRDDIEITLVDKRPFHTLMTELHEVAGWRTEPESVQVLFKKIFGAKKINIALDTIEKVDFEGKKATGIAQTYDFDYIVLGLGAEPEFFGIPGVAENSFTLWSFEDAMKVRRHIEEKFYEASLETNVEKRKKLLTFVVAGAGFTGIEMIGELLDYRDVMCRKYFLDPKEVRILNIEALPSILPILEEPLRAKAEAYLQKRRCEVMLNAAIIGAEPGKVLLKSGDIVETNTFIWTCGVKGSSFTGQLGLPMGKRNRLDVDMELKSTKYPNVYVVGDISGLIFDGKPLAQIVETAHFTAEAVAHNIISDIDGGERHQFKPNYHGFMISIGSHFGVSNAGGMKTSGFFALVIKHLINVYYLFNIAGINQIWEYLRHEFLDMKGRRSIIGDFASYKVRPYWPLLLRMWLGLMWVFEGINKIGEGWLNFGSGSQSGWMFSPGVIQAGVKVAEATSGASVAATAAQAAAPAVAATSAASAAAAPAAATSGTNAAAQTFKAVWDLTKPIFDPNSGIVTWFRHTFMDGIFAHLPFTLFQTMIVVTEMAIGLAIFGGCFTWLAAAASIVMCIVFTMSGMFAWNQLWFVFAAILMLGGLGRSFGIDYWLIPAIKHWWNGTKFARKWHFYAEDPTK